jgi:hypothetical protein
MDNEMSNRKIQKNPGEVYRTSIYIPVKKPTKKLAEGKMPGEEETESTENSGKMPGEEEEAIKSAENSGKMPGE